MNQSKSVSILSHCFGWCLDVARFPSSQFLLLFFLFCLFPPVTQEGDSTPLLNKVHNLRDNSYLYCFVPLPQFSAYG